MTNYDLLNHEVANAQKVVRKVSDLTIPEFKKLWIECYEELEQHKLDTSMEEYNRLMTKSSNTTFKKESHEL